MNIKPVNGWILVRRKEPETKIKGLMIHLSGDDYTSRECEVLAISHPRNMKTMAKAKDKGSHLQIGDRVLVVAFDGVPANTSDQLLQFVDHEMVLCKVPKEANLSRYQL